ncbi:hypothetical protein [Rhodovulum sp. PH10]|uniref:hypothetical protein n=1 Tax=Rhodovulum sp. PH10 TaxID=1187851 RepID=UPI00058E28D9|nr:hypothetical protein [Rhodovulum sp. PH10]
MTSRFVLTHSNDGVAQARREIARTKSARVHQSAPKTLVAFSLSDLSPRPTTQRSAPHVVVGIWSLEAWLAGLGGLIDALNKAQRTFLFYEVDAAMPAGLISRPERVAAWFKESSGRKPSKRILETLKDNLVADDFFGLAEKIRRDLTLDYIIGVTPSMVAGTNGDELFWNHFSTFKDRALLTSGYQLHEFAHDTGCPLESFIGRIIVSQLLVAMMWPKLGFHNDTGCLFDYNESRASLKDRVKGLHIEPGCLKMIKRAYRPAALAFVDLLRSYGVTK